MQLRITLNQRQKRIATRERPDVYQRPVPDHLYSNKMDIFTRYYRSEAPRENYKPVRGRTAVLPKANAFPTQANDDVPPRSWTMVGRAVEIEDLRWKMMRGTISVSAANVRQDVASLPGRARPRTSIPGEMRESTKTVDHLELKLVAGLCLLPLMGDRQSLGQLPMSAKC